MKHSVNYHTSTEFFVPMCIEKISPKYYYHSTSLHPFWVYFANFDFVCVLCAKMQIREHGIKKDLTVRSGRNCRYQINVVLSTQFTIFGFVGIAGYPFSFDNYHASFSCNVFWSHLLRLSHQALMMLISTIAFTLINYYFVIIFSMLLMPNRSMPCTTYRKFLSSCQSLFLVFNCRFWRIIGGRIPQHDNEVHNRRAPAVWNTFGKLSPKFDKIISCQKYFPPTFSITPKHIYYLHVV